MLFLEDRLRAGYLLGGLAAALLTWAFLAFTMVAEGRLTPVLQGVMGLGAGVLSWAPISLVAVFDVIPHILRYGLSRFDPVWILGGLSPGVTLGVAWWRTSRGKIPVWHALVSALLRFSMPLFGIQLVIRAVGLPKQYRWIFLFTGVMFLVLDALGAGGDLPLMAQRDEKGKGESP